MVSLSIIGMTGWVNPLHVAVRRPWTLFVARRRSAGAFFLDLITMKVYTCGKKFLPPFSNRSMPVKSMTKANHLPKYGECLSL